MYNLTESSLTKQLAITKNIPEVLHCLIQYSYLQLWLIPLNRGLLRLNLLKQKHGIIYIFRMHSNIEGYLQQGRNSKNEKQKNSFFFNLFPNFVSN